MNPPVLKPEPPAVAARRLAQLQAAGVCVVYCEQAEFGAKRGLRLSIHGVLATREIFLEVSDGTTTRVKSFHSRRPETRPGDDYAGLSAADMADAFRLARTMTGNWPRLGPFG